MKNYRLIIAEKPSAAKKIANALLKQAKAIKENGVTYYIGKDEKGENVVIASTAGHLFTLDEKKRSKEYPNFDVVWKPAFKKRKASFLKKFYEVLKKLAKNAGEYVIATDLDIEGEVIGYNIYRFICKEDGREIKVFRMCYSTLTKQELLKAYRKRKEGYIKGLAEAGLTRHYLDFYYGVNISKALSSSLENVLERYALLSSGRVQGPTLAILAKREEEIAKFKPKPYWQLSFSSLIGGQTIRFQFEKDKIWDKKKAETIYKSCKGKNAVITKIEKTKQIIKAPHPFDLTTLQTEAYRVFGFTPAKTQKLAQSLYLQALISYPRTSSQQLPPTIDFINILRNLKKTKFASLVNKVLELEELKPNNGKKVDPAHPAIHPTGEIPEKLTKDEEKLYSLIVHRFLATFYKNAVRERMKVTAKIDKYKFFASCFKILENGWLALYPFYKFEEQEIRGIEEGQEIKIRQLLLEEKETKPPKRYSQASIVKEMERLNLGTKATRAIILDTLYQRKYIEGYKQIKVTNLGMQVVKTLSKYAAQFLSPELTARFEEEMQKIEEMKKERVSVLEEAKKLLIETFSKFKEREVDIGRELASSFEKTRDGLREIGTCNKCGGKLRIIRFKGKRFIGCSNYPSCNNAFPLPKKGIIEKTGKTCEYCNLPKIRVVRKGKRPYEMCINPNCKSKQNWKNKKES